MIVEGNTTPGGGLTGAHVPLPTSGRRLHSGRRPTGFAWVATSGPDPDAIARLQRQGVLTVTEEVHEDRAVKVVRKAKPQRPPRARKLVPSATTGRPRVQIDEDALVEAYQAGKGLHALAREFRVARQTVRQRLVHLGIEIRRDGGQKGVRIDVEMARRLREKGLSYSAIARALGCSDRAVRNHLSDAKRSW